MANSSWWEEKLAANEARDHDTNRVLADAGWEVVRVWEHEMPDAVADRIKRAVETRLRNRSE